MDVAIFCTGRPDGSGSQTHDRWEVASMTWTGKYWLPKTYIESDTKHAFAGPVITNLGPDNRQLPTKDEYLGSLQFKDDPERYSAALLEFYDLQESVRLHYSYRCRIPLHRQRRGCGLNIPSGKSERIDAILTAIAQAGVSEISLPALAARVNPTR